MILGHASPSAARASSMQQAACSRQQTAGSKQQAASNRQHATPSNNTNSIASLAKSVHKASGFYVEQNRSQSNQTKNKYCLISSRCVSALQRQPCQWQNMELPGTFFLDSSRVLRLLVKEIKVARSIYDGGGESSIPQILGGYFLNL